MMEPQGLPQINETSPILVKNFDLGFDSGHPQEQLTNRLISHYTKLAHAFRDDLSRHDLAILAMGILRIGQDMLDAQEYLRLVAKTSPVMRKGL